MNNLLKVLAVVLFVGIIFGMIALVNSDDKNTFKRSDSDGKEQKTVDSGEMDDVSDLLLDISVDPKASSTLSPTTVKGQKGAGKNGERSQSPAGNTSVNVNSPTSQGVSSAAGNNGQTTVKTEPGVKAHADIKTDFDAISRKYSAVGASVAIIRNKRVNSVYNYGIAVKDPYRAVTQDTKYRVASLSKLVTDMLFMKLVENGKIKPTDNIEKYLGYKVRNPAFPERVITPEMLMTHTSSIIDSDAFNKSLSEGSSTELKDLLSDKASFSSFAPGTRYIYSNFGVAVIGAVCEKATGKYFNELAKELLFKPLDIDASYIAADIKNKDQIAELYGAGGGLSLIKQLGRPHDCPLGQRHHLVQGNLTISAKDYAKILCLLMNGGRDKDGKVIMSESSVKEIKKKHFDTGAFGVGYGLQIRDNIVQGNKVYVHTGISYGMYSTFMFSDEFDDAIVILTSGADAKKDESTGIFDISLEFIREFR
ncbi:MAG: beta-lactamase family protein [Clostridiales bacterium]|nr:beta-lactamase family protein [Clostridiales bacterium]